LIILYDYSQGVTLLCGYYICIKKSVYATESKVWGERTGRLDTYSGAFPSGMSIQSTILNSVQERTRLVSAHLDLSGFHPQQCTCLRCRDLPERHPSASAEVLVWGSRRTDKEILTKKLIGYSYVFPMF